MDKYERREYPRLSLSVYVGCEVMGSLDPIVVNAPSRDISQGGLSVILMERFEVGALLKLRFLIPGENNLITATGQLAWIDSVSGDNVKLKKAYNAGIKFIYIEDADRKKISNYVSKPRRSENLHSF